MENKKVIDIALQEYGTKEIKGKEHNEEVLKYFHDVGFDFINDDETPWCSAFACWVVKKAGLTHANSLKARDWLYVGYEVLTPEVGDVVVFWREKKEGWKGHVGFYISEDEKYIHVLGGNQSDQVNIKKYPKSRLLGYRRIQLQLTDFKYVLAEVKGGRQFYNILARDVKETIINTRAVTLGSTEQETARRVQEDACIWYNLEKGKKRIYHD